MTPAASWRIDFQVAFLRAHRAWLATQPQYVIPGLLDALDDPSLTPCARKTVHATQQQEAAGTGGIVEPAFPSPFLMRAGGLDSTTTGGGANPQPEKRAASQNGA